MYISTLVPLVLYVTWCKEGLFPLLYIMFLSWMSDISKTWIKLEGTNSKRPKIGIYIFWKCLKVFITSPTFKTLSLKTVKTQCLSQCQAVQRLVRSSHILIISILINVWSTESIFNQFSVFLKTWNALCVCLAYEHPRSIERVIRSAKSITSVKSQKCDFGAEPRFRLYATSAEKGLTDTNCNWQSVCLCVGVGGGRGRGRSETACQYNILPRLFFLNQ
jgi:hypothetical protein